MGRPSSREVRVDTWATYCPKTVTVEGVAVSSAWPLRVRAVEIWRYRYPGSRGGIKSVTVPVPKAASTGVPVWIDRTIPAYRYGYAGFVRVTITAGGETRTVAEMI